MKKILLIILLTTVSSIEYIAKAQGFKAEERQKIVNYVNCYYTARYILNNPDYKQENKAIEKYKINVDSVEDAYEYDTLYGYLKESGVLDYTADRLTKKLNDRNSSVTDSFYIVDYINKITDTDDFSNFKFTEEDKSKLADKILQWYISRHSKVESPRENRTTRNDDVNPLPVPQNEMGFSIWYLWLSIGFSIVCLVVIVRMMRKNRRLAWEIDSYDEEIRNKDEQYLMDDVSIIVARNKKNNSGIFVCDMLEWTDHNILNVLGMFPKELLTFLDPSIEYLECSLNDKKVDIRLKFYGKEEIIINNTRILENYLSSGTIKGLGVFMSAAFSFSESGYMIIDEIENHFNREIAATLIRFFMDEKVNKKGATILFSTHYSELLDEFERNDSIYIVRNKGGIGVENLSSILKRNDIKKSEVYDSGYLGETVPEYEAYMALKKVFEKRI